MLISECYNEFRINSKLEIFGNVKENITNYVWHFNFQFPNKILTIDFDKSLTSVNKIWDFLNDLCKNEQAEIIVPKGFDEQDCTLKAINYQNDNYVIFSIKSFTEENNVILRKSRLIANLWYEINSLYKESFKFFYKLSLNGDSELVYQYFQNKSIDKKLDEELIIAILNKNIDDVKCALKKGANPNAILKDPTSEYNSKYTALKHLTEDISNDEMYEDVVDDNKKAEFLIKQTVEYEIAKLLLDYGAEPNFYADNGEIYTALGDLVHPVFGNIKIAELLLKNGAHLCELCWDYASDNMEDTVYVDIDKEDYLNNFNDNYSIEFMELIRKYDFPMEIYENGKKIWGGQY